MDIEFGRPRGRGPRSEEQLNELGAEGWELCESITYTGGGTKYLILKRPVDVGPDTDVDTEATRD